MSSGHDNKRKRKANVPNVNDASPPPGRRVSARCRLPPKTSQDSPSSSSETQDLVKLKRRKSPPGAENPTRISPRRPHPRKDGSDSPSGDNMAIPSGLHTPVKSVPKKVMSRKVKILEEKEADNRKGYTSDGMSFESLPDDDLPDINIASPYKGKQYSKDDIVWAPFNTKHVSIYWPAVVTSVKGLNICFLYINFYGKPVYKTHAKRLIPFDNSSKNLELKELGNKTNGFKEAYELVIKYYCNRKQNTTLNARRFLTHTYDENDKVGLAKNCLFRLTGKLDSHSDDFEEVVEVEGVDIVNDVDINEEDDSCEEEKKPDSPQSERIKEILEDLETLPDHMTVSSKQHDRMREEAEQLLSIIQSKDCFEHLMEIRQGTLESSRHKKFMKGEKVQGGLGPFTLFMDLTDQFLSALDSHCDCYDSYDYKHNVMLPEAIIFGIMKLKKVSKLNAKKYFHQTCHKLGIRD